MSKERPPILHFSNLKSALIILISENNSKYIFLLYFSNSSLISNIALFIKSIGNSVRIFFSNFDSKKIVTSMSAFLI